MIPEVLRRTLIGVLMITGGVWIGGYVAIAVVARTATAVLEPVQRVDFFRALGGRYLRIGGPSLLIALACGAVLLGHRPWDAALVATVSIAFCLLLTLCLGVVQARSITRLRQQVLAAPPDNEFLARLLAAARRAVVLRAAIGVLTLCLVVLASVLID